MTCEDNLHCMRWNTVNCCLFSPFFCYQRHRHGCREETDAPKTLWSSRCTARLKRGEENGASCVVETRVCKVAGLPGSHEMSYCYTEQETANTGSVKIWKIIHLSASAAPATSHHVYQHCLCCCMVSSFAMQTVRSCGNRYDIKHKHHRRTYQRYHSLTQYLGSFPTPLEIPSMPKNIGRCSALLHEATLYFNLLKAVQR